MVDGLLSTGPTPSSFKKVRVQSDKAKKLNLSQNGYEKERKYTPYKSILIQSKQ